MKTRVRLFALVVFASAALAQNAKPAAPKPQDYSFTISTERVWTDTGLDLEPRDRVHVYGASRRMRGPNSQRKGALAIALRARRSCSAKLHGEAGPILASPDADMPIIENSRLYLGVNGWHCHGTIAAKVHVTLASSQTCQVANRRR